MVADLVSVGNSCLAMFCGSPKNYAYSMKWEGGDFQGGYQAVVVNGALGWQVGCGWQDGGIGVGSGGRSVCLCASRLGTSREDSWCRTELVKEHLLDEPELKVMNLTSKGRELLSETAAAGNSPQK